MLTKFKHKNSKEIFIRSQAHPYHLVDPSPWPILCSSSAFVVTLGAAAYMHNFKGGGFVLLIGVISLLYITSNWWSDVTRESTFEGSHTKAVVLGFRFGMFLFILSEVMFFFAFFWAFFHSSISPAFNLGGIWPPRGIETLNPWEVPLLNTALLLCSGATITWTHHSVFVGFRKASLLSLFLTIFLALLFTLFQMVEYYTAPFSISDSVYGSTFFLATGFHGFHVFVGTCFLMVCGARLFCYHFTTQHHFGFEAAAWYWHFVDIVWLFLFVTLYWWGS